MQLLRVASTMSYQGSPYSGPGDDYDFEDDGYDDLDEYREHEESLPPPPVDDSDEDTEEASETDVPKNDEPLEVKEQMYQDKLANLKKQLVQLEEGLHSEYLRRVKRLDHQLHERLRLNKIYKDHMFDVVEKEYAAEKKAAAKEFEEKKIELRENLLNDFEDKKKMIENERHSMELNGDSMEVKPVMKRILRRRANEPAPAPEKRRKPLATTLTFQLDERDVDADLRAIARHSPTRHHANAQAPVAQAQTHAPTHPPPRKHLNSTNSYRFNNATVTSTAKQPKAPLMTVTTRQCNINLLNTSRVTPPSAESVAIRLPGRRGGCCARAAATAAVRQQRCSSGDSPVRESSDTVETRVEDGKLLFERRWFHRGQSVYVEGRDVPRFPGHIHAITDEAIWVKRPNLERFRIYISQLARGKVTLKRRAS